ncbi:site-2 protease family protein [Candidatus Dojkabacteria bacterium]|nr:site-2 protease family protein [Candidatus Dojkabacteria bacterium]
MLILLEATLWLILIIGLVIFIHELGHFVAAKLVGVKVEEFALGFGKKIFSKKFGSTEYRINLIPYGGYVKLLGEEEESKKLGSFGTKPVWAKAVVIVGGVVMNFLLAIFTFYIVLILNNFQILFPRYADYKFIGTEVEVYNKPFVAGLIEGTPAYEVNFPINSIIWEIGGEEVKSAEEFQSSLYDHKGEEIIIKVLTIDTETGGSGDWQEVKVTPRETSEEGVLLGVKFDSGVASYYNLNYSKTRIFSGLFHSINFTGYNLELLQELISISIAEKTVKPVAEGVGGVVGLANTTIDIVKIGDLGEMLNLLGMVNISIAIMNILPFPVLDGGALLVIIIEKITGKKLPEKYQNWMIRIGFVVLTLFVILITIKDIIQFDVFSRIINFVKNLF